MIGYVTIGVSNMEKARDFYGALFNEMGGEELFGFDRIKFFGKDKSTPMLAVCIPYDEQSFSCGNGSMISFPAGSKENVDALYAKAIELGATDEGKPGERVPDFFYGAYVRDQDGHKLCFYQMS